MEAYESSAEQNGSGEGRLPESGGAGNGATGSTGSDCELTLELPWTYEEGEIFEMCNATVGSGGDFGGRGGSEGGGSLGGSGSGSDDGEGHQKGAAMKKGPWTMEEDALLIKAVHEHGLSDWITIQKLSGLARTSKSCRLRWANHLRPNLKKGAFSFEEERLLVKLHHKYGNKWSRIARKLPGRTDNEIKNFWHGLVKKCNKHGLPIYPDWCKEEEQTYADDDDDHGRNYDVGEQKSLISIAMKHSGTTSLSVQPVSWAEYQLPSTSLPCSQGQETLPSCSDQNLVSSSSLLPQHHPNSFQTPQILQHQHNSISAPHCLPSAHEPSLMDQSIQEPNSSFQDFLSPRPKSANSWDLPSTSSSSAMLQLSSPRKTRSVPAQEPSSECHANMPLSNSNFSSFTPLRPPPILSSLSSQFKQSQNSSTTRAFPHSFQNCPIVDANSSSTSEQPVSSLQLNSSTTSGASFIMQSEPPSIQSLQKGLKSTPDMRKNSEMLDALLQETQAEASLFDLKLIEGFLLSKDLKTKHLYENIIRKKMLENIAYSRAVLMRGSLSRESLSSGSSRTFDLQGHYPYTKFQKTIDFSSGKSTRECSSDIVSTGKDLLGRSVAIGVPGNSSRKQDPLTKTNGKDEQGNESLDRENLFGESLLRENLKRKGPISESLEQKFPTSTRSKRDQNSRELLRKEHVWSKGVATSDVSRGNIHSARFSATDYADPVSESSKRMCFRDKNMIGDLFGESSRREGSLAIHGQGSVSDTLNPLFSQRTSNTRMISSDSIAESSHAQSSKGAYLAESFEKEWSEMLLAELLESPQLIRSSHPWAKFSSPQPSTAEHFGKCVKTDDSWQGNESMKLA